MFIHFVSLLTLGSLLAVGCIALSSMTASGRSFWQVNLGPNALLVACIVAVVTMGGSLYLSEVLKYRPCRLCWIQCGLAYPLALILPVALLSGRRQLHRVALPLAAVGLCVSGYHIALEYFPSLEGSATCDPSNPCSLIWVKNFRFVTIPVMAFASFVLQLALVLTSWTYTTQQGTQASS